MKGATVTRYVNSAIWIAPEIHISSQTQQPSGRSLPGEAVLLICGAALPDQPTLFLRSLRSSEPGDTRNCRQACARDNAAVACHGVLLLWEVQAAFRLHRYATLLNMRSRFGHGSTWAMTAMAADLGRAGLPSEPSCWIESEPMSRALYAVSGSGEARRGADLANADVGCPLTAAGDADRVLCPL